jgi:predicted ATPase
LLRSYRLAAGLSQEALAERARISVQGIGALERGDRRTPQRETLRMLTKALALGTEDRATFEAAAARQSAPRAARSVAAGPWPEAVTSNLPVGLTDIVGRGTELAEIAALLLERRLVTLTGTGGIGKTTAALEVAGAFYDDASAGEAWLVELAPLTDPQFVTSTIASALGVVEIPHRSLFETLLAHLRPKNVLLVLDNCEHVIAEAARVTDELLRGCLGLRILATSREALRVPGEHTFRLPPLGVPSLAQARELVLADVASYPAIALFAERARAADRRFELTDSSVPVVAEICSRLDGIPLAIELAAARLRSLPLRLLAEKLDQHLALLTTGARGAPQRQQTMHATIDWSYELLAEPERRVFERLSIFAGGCTLEAATVVCGDSGESEDDVLLLLSLLVEKSLVISDDGAALPRFRMLESFRQFGRERLIERGELDAVLHRHMKACLALAERCAELLHGMSDREWMASTSVELENWRAALEWALGTRADVVSGQRLTAALNVTWHRLASAEGRRWVRLALELVDERTPDDVAADLDSTDAMLSERHGEVSAALAAAHRAIARYRELGDLKSALRPQMIAGITLIRLGQPDEAETLLVAALKAAREFGRPVTVGNILDKLAVTLAMHGDLDAARAACVEALSIFERLGKTQSAAIAMTTLADIERRAGDVEAALRLVAEALHSCGSDPDTDTLRSSLNANMAAYLVALNRFEEARTFAREALDLASRLQNVLLQTWALQHFAAIAALAPHDPVDSMDQLSRGARLHGFVDAQYAALGAPPEPTDGDERERIWAALRAAIPPEDLAFLIERGAATSAEEAFAEALRV